MEIYNQSLKFKCHLRSSQIHSHSYSFLTSWQLPQRRINHLYTDTVTDACIQNPSQESFPMCGILPPLFQLRVTNLPITWRMGCPSTVVTIPTRLRASSMDNTLRVSNTRPAPDNTRRQDSNSSTRRPGSSNTHRQGSSNTLQANTRLTTALNR